MNFVGNDASILFRYPAVCKARVGEVVVTDVCFRYLCSEGSDQKQYTWESIKKVEYGNSNDPSGQAIILLKMMMQGSEDVTISLVGSSKEKNFSELDNLKEIISNIHRMKKFNLMVMNDEGSEIDLNDHAFTKKMLDLFHEFSLVADALTLRRMYDEYIIINIYIKNKL